MIKNLIIEERSYRYDTIVRQFASCLYILGGRTAFESVRFNIAELLPSVQIIQSYVAASENHLTEGLFTFDGMPDHFNLNQSTLGFCAEDARNYSTIKSSDFGPFILPSLRINKSGYL